MTLKFLQDNMLEECIGGQAKKVMEDVVVNHGGGGFRGGDHGFPFGEIKQILKLLRLLEFLGGGIVGVPIGGVTWTRDTQRAKATVKYQG